jgi:hypothetical protein
VEAFGMKGIVSDAYALGRGRCDFGAQGPVVMPALRQASSVL